MDAEKIAELRRLEAAATPGPWIANAYGRGGVHVYDPERHAKKQPGEGPALWHDQVFDFANSRHDEILTAAARNALPALLALAERAAELERLVRRAATESTVTVSDHPGCFYCDSVEHTKDCPAAKLLHWVPT